MPLPLVRGSSLRSQILSNSIGSIGLNVANVCLAFAMAVILARSLGPKGYGLYSYVFALMSLLLVPAQFGVPNLLVRETANAEAKEQWGLMLGVWRWAALVAGGLSLALLIIGAVAGWLFANDFSRLQLTTYALGLLFVPLLALSSLNGAALRGLRKVVLGMMPLQIIRPSLLILLVLCFGVFSGTRIRADHAMALNVVAMAIAFLISVWLLARHRPKQLANAYAGPVYESRRWLFSAVPFALIAGVNVINTQIDIVMLGIFATPQDVGLYRVAARGATLVSIAFMAIGLACLPYFARFHVNGEMRQLQRLATLTARISFTLALPVVIFFTLFGDKILGVVFGPSYAAASIVLIILSIAQIASIGFGMNGRILNMAGYEMDTAKGAGLGAVVNIILNAFLIPLYGMAGAAVGTGLSILTWNVMLTWYGHKRLGMNTTIFTMHLSTKLS